MTTKDTDERFSLYKQFAESQRRQQVTVESSYPRSYSTACAPLGLYRYQGGSLPVQTPAVPVRTTPNGAQQTKHIIIRLSSWPHG